MREFKFRAWSNARQKMLKVGDEFGTTHPLDCAVYKCQGQDVVLMQYTGLKDKNGKEIYEGDIIRVVDTDEDEEWTFVVEYEDGGYWFDVTKLFYDFDVCSFGFVNKTLDYLEYEIIGNIYENPELLKGEST